MPWSLRRLFFRLKDLWHFLAGCLWEHSRWVGGGSKVGENRTSAKNVGSPFASMPHSPKEETRKDCQCSRRSMSRTERGGSRHEPPGRRSDCGPAKFAEEVRHCMIPREGAGVGEMGVPVLPTAAENYADCAKSL